MAKKRAAKAGRLRAVTMQIYPKPEYLADVKRAGGLSKLKDEQKAKMLRKVMPGGWCDDLPPAYVADLIANGRIEEVEPESAAMPDSEEEGE